VPVTNPPIPILFLILVSPSPNILNARISSIDVGITEKVPTAIKPELIAIGVPGLPRIGTAVPSVTLTFVKLTV